MAAATIYKSATLWNPARPDTVIISYVDGRWRSQIQEFTVNHLKADLHADFLAVPGGIYFARLAGSDPARVVFEAV